MVSAIEDQTTESRRSIPGRASQSVPPRTGVEALLLKARAGMILWPGAMLIRGGSRVQKMFRFFRIPMYRNVPNGRECV